MEMNLVDLFYPCIQNGVHTVHYTFVAILLATFFQNVTSLNLSATRWTNQAEHSIPWIMLRKLIWNKCLCFDLFLPHLSAAENLVELQLDYCTFEVNYRTVPNLMHLHSDNHELTIFHNLQNCRMLKNFSCAHSKICWSPNVPRPIPIVFTHIGTFCTSWLLRSAPLSLRKYTGPLDTRNQFAVMQRYSTIDNNDNPVITLIPKPIDNSEWV